MTVVDPRLVTNAVYARLVDRVSGPVFDGEVPDHPGTLAGSGRTVPYAVLYPFGLQEGPDGELADAGLGKTYSCQVSCAAGFRADCEYIAQEVDQALNRWTPTVAGLTFGRFKPPPGFSPGAVRRDDTIIPSRFSIALQYLINVTP